MIKTIHLVSSLIMLLIFVASGQYLNFVLPPLEGTLDGNRMMYRAGHVYLMMSASVNLACGVYYTAFAGGLAVWLQRIGAWLVITSQPVLLWAFLVEPGDNATDRVLTQLGCIALFVGAVVMFLAWVRQHFNSAAGRD